MGNEPQVYRLRSGCFNHYAIASVFSGHQRNRPYEGSRRKWIDYADKDLTKVIINLAEVFIEDLGSIAGHGGRSFVMRLLCW